MKKLFLIFSLTITIPLFSMDAGPLVDMTDADYGEELDDMQQLAFIDGLFLGDTVLQLAIIPDWVALEKKIRNFYYHC